MKGEKEESNEWEREGIQLSFFLFLSPPLAENAPGTSAARLVSCEQDPMGLCTEILAGK